MHFFCNLLLRICTLCHFSRSLAHRHIWTVLSLCWRWVIMDMYRSDQHVSTQLPQSSMCSGNLLHWTGESECLFTWYTGESWVFTWYTGESECLFTRYTGESECLCDTQVSLSVYLIHRWILNVYLIHMWVWVITLYTGESECSVDVVDCLSVSVCVCVHVCYSVCLSVCQRVVQTLLLLVIVACVPWMLLPKPLILRQRHRRHQQVSYLVILLSFLSRVSTLMCDIDIAILAIHQWRSGIRWKRLIRLSYCHSFLTVW